ncbi:MAG TPA: TatD family hydrolase [Candidatus Woesebacteria bacterium]|nr:TatD family hydrolase [Candidatus Woesebacteria bacterium]
MPIIDTHCHYNLEPLYSGQPFCFKIKADDPLTKLRWQDHWQAAQKKGVQKSIIVGPGLSSSKKALEIAATDKNLYASVGIHPERTNKIINLAQAKLELASLAQNDRVVAIGETGLDYFYLQTNDQEEITKTKLRQKELFIDQIKLAVKLRLPLILHVRDKEEKAYYETLKIIEQYWAFDRALIFHCVSGPLDYVKKALEYKNSYFGFDGNITFQKAENIRTIFKLVQKTDPQKILLETDAPYLAPEPYRGQVCEPQMITVLANYLEKNCQANLSAIYQNSLCAFKLA